MTDEEKMLQRSVAVISEALEDPARKAAARAWLIMIADLLEEAHNGHT